MLLNSFVQSKVMKFQNKKDFHLVFLGLQREVEESVRRESGSEISYFKSS